MTAPPHDIPPQEPIGEEHQPHKPADDREEIYYEGSPSLRWQLAKGWPWLIVGLLFTAVPIVAYAMSKNGIAWWWIPIGLVAGFAVLMIPYIKSLTLRYKITNYRIDRETGLVGKKFDTLELWHVEDIELRQPALARILGVGTILVHSHDRTTEHLTMDGIPRPRAVFESLKQRIIAVKRQRGVVKMDIPATEHPMQ